MQNPLTKKIISGLVAFLFLFTSFAGEYAALAASSYTGADRSHLAPQLRLTSDQFKDQYLASETLLAHRAANTFISGYMHAEIPHADGSAIDLTQLKHRVDTVSVVGAPEAVDQELLILSIPGLLRNTGQLAHLGLGRKNGIPVIYVDSAYFYNEDVLLHEKDEIARWEGEAPLSLGLDYNGMREWILKDPDAKALAASFHRDSHPVDHLYETIKKDHPGLVNLDSLYAYYCAYGLDEDDADVNIAAASKKKMIDAHVRAMLPWWQDQAPPGLEEMVRGYVAAIMEHPGHKLFFAHFRDPRIIQTPEELDPSRPYSMAAVALAALDPYAGALDGPARRRLLATVGGNEADQFMMLMLGGGQKNYDTMLCSRYAAKLAEMLAHDRKPVERTLRRITILRPSIKYDTAIRSIEAVVEFAAPGDPELAAMLEQMVDTALKDPGGPTLLLERLGRFLRLRELNAARVVLESEWRLLSNKLSSSAPGDPEILLERMRPFFDSLPRSVMTPFLAGPVDYREWAEDIVRHGDALQILLVKIREVKTDHDAREAGFYRYSHVYTGRDISEIAEASADPEEAGRFFYYYNLSSPERQTEIARRVEMDGKASLADLVEFAPRLPTPQLLATMGRLLDAGEWEGAIRCFDNVQGHDHAILSRLIVERLNRGGAPADKEMRARLYVYYENLIEPFERRVGLLTDPAAAGAIYAAGADLFREESREAEDNRDFIPEGMELEFGESEDADIDSRQMDAERRRLISFYVYNSSPELLKQALNYWNDAQLVTDDELNAFNWVIHNIPKGVNTRDERRRLHSFILLLVQRRMGGRSVRTDALMSDAVVHMDTAVTDKQLRNDTALAFLRFAMVYATMPQQVQNKHNGRLWDMLKKMVSDAGKKRALGADEYRRLYDELITLLREELLATTLSLSQADVRRIEESINRHPGAWLEDNLLIQLARYHGFQADEGKQAVEQYLLELADAAVEGNAFTGIPRYRWDDPAVREWFGDALVDRMQAGYAKSFTLAGGAQALVVIYRDIWSDMLVHLGLGDVPDGERAKYLQNLFTEHNAGDSYAAFQEMLVSVQAALQEGRAVSFDEINGWKERAAAAQIDKVFPYPREFLINLDQIGTVQRDVGSAETKASFIVTEEPVAFIKSAIEPYYTCQRIIEPTGHNSKGQPINRARQGQFILAQVKVGDRSWARAILEIAKDKRTGKKVLLVERLYTGGAVTTTTFQDLVMEWAIATGGIDHVVFSGVKPPAAVGVSVQVELLPSAGAVYRDTAWKVTESAFDVAKYKKRSTAARARKPMAAIRTGFSSSHAHRPEGSTAALLEDIKKDGELLTLALDSSRGISIGIVAKHRDSVARRTLQKEFALLRSLGILVPVDGKANHYTFSELMRGPDAVYTKTLINMVNDIEYQVGKKGDARALHRGNIPDAKLPVVRELLKMEALKCLMASQRPAIPPGKTLWHIIDQGLVAESQRSSFAQKVNNASRKSNAPERVYIMRTGESFADAVAAITAICPEAAFDIALSSPAQVDFVPEGVGKMLVFRGVVGDVSHLEGLVAALRTLHCRQEDIMPMLLKIYALMTGAAYEGKTPPPSLLQDDPKAFARQFIFDLPPITAIPPDDMVKINERMLKIMTSA